MPWNRLLTTASALALAGCMTVGPDFKRPQPAAAAAPGYAMAGDPAAPQAQFGATAAGPWWRAFGSPVLDGLVEAAFAGNPTLAEADAALARAEAERDVARGAQAPQLDAKASAARMRVDPIALGFPGIRATTLTLYQVGAAASFDLDVFGGLRRGTEAASARAEAEARRTDAAYLTLAGQVSLQAVTLAALNAQIGAAEAATADDQRLLDMGQSAVDAGGRAPSELAVLRARLAEDEAELPALRRERDAVRHQLALLVGKAPGQWAAPDLVLADLHLPEAVPVSLPSELIRQRPDILAAEADLHAATADVGVAVANQYPKLTLTPSVTQAAVRPGDLFSYDATNWTLGGGLAAPLFEGGRLKARRRAAEAQARAAMARYQRTVLGAFVQVSDLLAALAEDSNELDALTRATAAGDVRVQNARTAYRLGGGTLLQATDAQRDLNRTRRSLAAAQGRQAAHMVQLFVAIAADWRAGPKAAAS